jgi:hypothetical protein
MPYAGYVYRFIWLDTAEFRNDQHATTVRVRELLRVRGIDLARSIVAWFYRDDTGCYGILCTPDGRVIEFALEVGEQASEPMELTKLADTTDSEAGYHTDYVLCALELARGGSWPA